MDELIKVMIVDDHEIVRNALEKEFCAKNGFVVVKSLSNARESLAFCTLHNPNIVIMDICTEDGASGLDATGKIKEKFPKIKIIVTTGFNEISYIPRAKQLGAHAFIYKNNGLEYYREVANQVLKGNIVFPETKIIIMPKDSPPFSKREMDIIKLLCKPMNKQKIAEELSLSEHTVKRHVENILHKSGFSTYFELVVYIVSNGWINSNYQ